MTNTDLLILADRVEGLSRLPRADFIRQALTAEIASMLDELGNPPLVERIFPKGWRSADDTGLNNLYDLCIRTFATRSPDLRTIAANQEGSDAS